MHTDLQKQAVGMVTGDRPTRSHQGRNGMIHALSLSLTKIADGLVDPKLVLAWLLSALGAPAGLIGALVPVREAGALLPQLILARWLAGRQRKWLWIIGSAGQGVAALGIALAALFLSNISAGLAIIGFLAVLAVSRAACSVSYKDALARSMDQGRRGAITGFAGSAASVFVFGFAAALALNFIPLQARTITIAVGLAGLFWLLAALLFNGLAERPVLNQQSGGQADGFWIPLRDGQFRLFVATRGLLTVTALAPPFLLLIAGKSQSSGLGQLGPMMVASALASILSGYIWGRLSDRSSRLCLVFAGGVAALVFSTAAALEFLLPDLNSAWPVILLLFCAQIAYQGVRAGRKMHLTDMAQDQHRAGYTALSNSLIGLALLAGAGFGWLAELIGLGGLMTVYAVLAGLGALLATMLRQVQKDASQ